MNGFSITYSNRYDLEQRDYDLIIEHGKKYGKGADRPVFRSYRPGFPLTLLDKVRCQFLIPILEQAIEVCKMFKINPSFLNGDEGFYTRYHDDDWNWHGEWQEHPIRFPDVPVLENELDLQRLKKKRKVFPIPVEFNVSFSPTLINDHAGGRPYYLFISLAIETELGKVIYFNMDKERDLATVV